MGQPEPPIFPRGLALLVAGALFMEILDATVIATAIPAMAESFGAAPVDLNVAISAYLVTLAVLIPVSGWVAERFGVRRVFLAAIVVFTLASLGCAASTSLPMLVAMRIGQGVGGAMMVPVGRLAVLRTTGKGELVKAIAYLTWPALVAPVLAPAIGGAIVTYTSWRWIFVLNLPLGVIGFVFALRLVPPGRGGTARRLDWLGLAATALGIGAVLVALESIRVSGTPWARVGVEIAAGVALLVAAVWHLRRVEHPLLDLDVLRIPSFRSTALYGSIYRAVITAVPFLLPLMFQLWFGWTPLAAGLMVMALFAGNIAIKPTTTPLMRRFGIRGVLLWVGVATVACFGVLALLVPATPLVLIALTLCLSGALRSIGFTGYNSLAFADVGSGELTDANTLHATAQELFSGVGIAVGAIALTVSAGVVADLGWTAGREYSMAFAALGVVMLVIVWGAWRLPRDAGAAVTGWR
ncbi:MAG TPA: MFS transporter [Aldersonia sp.]